MGFGLRIGGYQGAQSIHTRAVGDLIADLNQPPAEPVDVAFRKNVTEDGHQAVDLLKMVAGDDLDICYFSSSYLTSQIASLSQFEIPFASRDRTEFYAMLDGPKGRQAQADAAELSPYVILGFWDNGIRNISNRRHEIHGPADCAGLRIRTLKNAYHQDVFRAMGFEPRAIDVRDLPGAVVSGEVDAQENPLTNILNFELHKVHRFITLTGHFFGVALLLCNRARYESWPDDMRQRIDRAVAVATANQRRYAAAEDARCVEVLKADGVTITELTAAERAAFQAAVAGVERH